MDQVCFAMGVDGVLLTKRVKLTFGQKNEIAVLSSGSWYPCICSVIPCVTEKL